MNTTRKQKRSYKRVIILGMVLLLGIASVAYMNMGLHRTRSVGEGLMAGKSEVHVMIMGVDQREDDVGRSDTLMLATVDTSQGKASLLSIPRDTRVRIEGNGYDKINHAYAFGGHELTQGTVEHLLGIPVDYYVLVNIHAFERIVDAMGGVDIDVEKRMYYEDPWDDDGGLVIDLYPGEQHMDGRKAIQYVRYRDGEGDIGRIGRQQKFMKAMLEKAISPQILPKLPTIIDEIAAAVKTNMSPREMLSFANLLKKVHDNGMQTEMVPGKPAYLQDISYWLPDIKALRTWLAGQMGLKMEGDIAANAEKAEKEYAADLPKGLKIVNEAGTQLAASDMKKDKAAESKTKAGESKKPRQPSEITVMVINSSGINGAGAETADILRRKGFKVSSVETGRTSSRQQTTITTAAKDVNQFYGMPFACVIMEGGESGQAVLNIGRDYKK